MNVSSWLKEAKKRIDSLDAELLLLRLLNENDRSFLVAHGDMLLMPNDLDVLERMVKMREAHAPLAYILGVKEFYGREFLIERSVLVPRVESEVIIDIVSELSRALSSDVNRGGEAVKVLDVGTGSGCLAVTISLENPDAKVTAVDTSVEALRVAMDNMLNLGAKVEFAESDLLERVRGEKFDIIVANLPYVDEDWDWTSKELEWEPKEALFALDGGLEVIFRLIDEVVKYKNTKYLILESDVSQQGRIEEYATMQGLKLVETRGYQMVFLLF